MDPETLNKGKPNAVNLLHSPPRSTSEGPCVLSYLFGLLSRLTFLLSRGCFAFVPLVGAVAALLSLRACVLDERSMCPPQMTARMAALPLTELPR